MEGSSNTINELDECDQHNTAVTTDCKKFNPGKGWKSLDLDVQGFKAKQSAKPVTSPSSTMLPVVVGGKMQKKKEEYFEKFKDLLVRESAVDKQEVERRLLSMSEENLRKKGLMVNGLSAVLNGTIVNDIVVRFQLRDVKLKELNNDDDDDLGDNAKDYTQFTMHSNDPVIVSKVNPLKDDKVYEGTFLEKRRGAIYVAIRNTGNNLQSIFKNTKPWRIDSDVILGHFKIGSSLDAACAAEPALPKSSKSVVSCDPVPDDWHLNASQRRAIDKSLRRRVSLIQGPPGTGKSHTAIHLIRALVHQKNLSGSTSKILVTSFTNTGVDNLLEGLLAHNIRVLRLGLSSKVRDDLRSSTLESRLQEEMDKLFPPSSKRDEHISTAKYGATERDVRKRLISSVDVICATCISSGNDILADEPFPIVVVDEATQATEPAILIPLLKSSEQLFLFGDQNQLSPTVMSIEAQKGGLSISLFERLVNDGVAPFLLDEQYRMHSKISEFPSKEFYGGLLKNGIKDDQRPVPNGFKWPKPNTPVAFVNVECAEDTKSNSYFNVGEATEIVGIVKKILSNNSDLTLNPITNQMNQMDQGFLRYSLNDASLPDVAGSLLTPASNSFQLPSGMGGGVNANFALTAGNVGSGHQLFSEQSSFPSYESPPPIGSFKHFAFTVLIHYHRYPMSQSCARHHSRRHSTSNVLTTGCQNLVPYYQVSIPTMTLSDQSAQATRAIVNNNNNNFNTHLSSINNGFNGLGLNPSSSLSSTPSSLSGQPSFSSQYGGVGGGGNNFNNFNLNAHSLDTISPISPRLDSLGYGYVSQSAPLSNRNSISPQQQQQQQVESYVLKETPSRTLFVGNISPLTDDDVLQSLFSAFGPVKSIMTKCKHRGFIIVDYYDIRHAISTVRNFKNTEIHKKKVDICYTMLKDYNSDLGTLVVFNLDPSITNPTLLKIFGAYGQIKEIRETPNKTHHKFIEYFDIRDAAEAIKNLNKVDLCGKKLRIQHSRPGGAKKNLPSTVAPITSDPYDLNPLFADSLQNRLFHQASAASSTNSSPSNSGLSLNAQQQTTPNSLTGVSPMSLPVGWKAKLLQQHHNSLMGADGSSASSPLSELQLLSPTSPPSSPRITSLLPKSGTNIKSPRGEKSPRNKDGSSGPGTPNSSSANSDHQFILSIDKVKQSLDCRTSLMIKNLPNRLTQTNLLSIIDEHFRGAYDFLYLPIDPNSKVNYGYAFINFTDYNYVVPFYSEFNSRKWDKYYCSKVCEITYARIQGKLSLIQHLKSSNSTSAVASGTVGQQQQLSSTTEDRTAMQQRFSPIIFVADFDGVKGGVEKSLGM
eukprot:gene13891-16387_t